MNAFIELLNRLSVWLDAWLRNRKAKKQQAERDALERSPADWFSQHFDDGMHDTEAADSTDKTQPHNRGEG